MDFKNLKKNSKTSLSDLTKKLENEAKKTVYADKDETYWQPTLDKAGNGSAVIRLLPAPPQDGEDGTPWVKFFRHSFQGAGGWYIENSLTSLGKADPAAEHNNKLWTKAKAENNKALEELARKQKRKLTYVSGIEVISDPAKPECNGNVYRWKYGQKLFAKFEEAMSGDEGDEVTPATPGFDPFDFWEGANFRLKVTRQGDFPNYDDSKFGPKTPHKGGDDKALETVWKTQHSLKEILDEKNFKTYEKLKERLDKVLALSDTNTETAEPVVEAKRKTAETTKVAPKTTKNKTVVVDETPPWEPDTETDPEAEDNLKYFQSLVDQD